jgi:carbohydrate diacid regulator
MQLTLESAQQIVNEIGRLVHQQINMMDETGTIIASTDVRRIGQSHEGARRIIMEHLPELYIAPENESPTARRGINLPIEFDGKIVGVIGITGGYGEVIGYGQVVKKMTEILIEQRSEMDQQRLDSRVRSRFLEEWVLGEGLTHASALAERGLTLGIDITAPRRILVASLSALERYTDTLAGQRMLEQAEAVVSKELRSFQGAIILRNSARQILLMPSHSTADLCALAAKLADAVYKACGVHLIVGIDDHPADVHTAYLEANRAWRAASHRPGGILSYSEMRLELFLDDIPRRRKAEYLHRLFPGSDAAQMRTWVGLLEAWFSAEGSLHTAADALFIHKNTLQYRIRRLQEISGLDVRLPSQAPALYMGMLFFRDLENDLSYLEN